MIMHDNSANCSQNCYDNHDHKMIKTLIIMISRVLIQDHCDDSAGFYQDHCDNHDNHNVIKTIVTIMIIIDNCDNHNDPRQEYLQPTQGCQPGRER